MGIQSASGSRLGRLVGIVTVVGVVSDIKGEVSEVPNTRGTICTCGAAGRDRLFQPARPRDSHDVQSGRARGGGTA